MFQICLVNLIICLIDNPKVGWIIITVNNTKSLIIKEASLPNKGVRWFDNPPTQEGRKEDSSVSEEGDNPPSLLSRC